MTNPLEHIKPAVRAMKAYTLMPHTYRYKMNQNENPLGYPPELKEQVMARIQQQDWARYPDFDLVELTEALAAHLGVSPAQVLVGNGSNEIIYNTMAVTLRDGDSVVIPVPTFSVYKLVATVMGARVREPIMRPETLFALPTDEVIQQAQEHQARLVVLCTPNNPTGRSVPIEEVRRVCRAVDSLVLIDEAYQEFSSQNLLELVAEFPNVILLRTFSKAMALGGMRVGYCVTNEALAREIHKGKLPYALNAFSEAAAVVALHNMPLFQAEVDQILYERDRLYAKLDALSFVHPVPSDANFIIARFDGFTPQQVFQHLLERGILVRDISSNIGLGDYLRLSVGAPHENDELIESLREMV
jgi:histidinol-phosphate aminotransferase